MKKAKVFLRRSQKVVVKSSTNQIVIPFRPLTIIGICVLFITSSFLLLRSDIFIIHKVKTIGTSHCVGEEALIQNLNLLGRSIFFADFAQSKETVLKRFPCIGSVFFVKKFPDEVTVEISLRTPRVLIYKRDIKESTHSASLNAPEATASAKEATLNASTYRDSTASAQVLYVVDDLGVIFSEHKETLNLPRIEVPQDYNLSLGWQIKSEPFMALVSFLREVSVMNISVMAGKVEKESSTVFANDGFEIKISGKKDGRLQAQSLQAILAQAKIEGVILEKIDFSFEKPVIKTKKSND